MKITHVIQHLGLGGAESFVIELANQQQRNGHEVDVLIVGKEQHLRDGLRVPSTSISRKDGPDVRAIRAVGRHLRDNKTDVVHAHTAPGLVYGGLGAVLARTPVKVFTEHSSSSPSDQYGRKTQLLELIAARYDAIVTFDDDLQRQLAAKRTLRNARVVVIPNGVSINDETVWDRATSRQELGVTDNAVVVLAVGALRPQKNYELLIDVAQGLTTIERDGRSHPVQFVIVGEGTERSKLETKIAASNVGNVRLLGGFANARRLFRGADLLLNTSTWEGMPISMLEAMAENLPIVATRTGSVETLLGPDGSFLEMSAPSMSAELSRLLSNPSDLREIANRGFDRVTRYFSIPHISQSYEDLYTSLLDKVPPSANPTA